MISLSGLSIILVASCVACAGNLLARAGIDSAGGYRPAGIIDAALGFLKLLSEPKFTGGMLLYVVSMLIWFRIISSEPLSVAYPVMLSLTIVMVTVGATVFFDERITFRLVIGIVLIIAGVAAVAADGRPV